MKTNDFILNKKIAVAIFGVGVTAFAALNCLQPIIPAMGKSLGLQPAAASMISSAGMLGVAIMLFALTFLAEKLPRQKFIIGSLLICSTLTALLSVLPAFSLLLIVRFITGMSIAFIPTLMMAYIQEEFSASQIAYISGLYISGTTIGGLSGRLITSCFTDISSWQTSLAICGAFLIAVSVLVQRLLPKEQQQRQSSKKFSWSFFSWKNKSLFLLCLLGFCIMGSFVSIFNYIPFVLMDKPYNISQSVIGLIFLVQICGFVSSSLCGRLVKALGTERLLLMQLIVMLVGVILTLPASLALKLLGLAAVNFGFFGAHACAISWCGTLCPTQKAASVALYMLCYYLGASIMGSYCGIFYQQHGWSGVTNAVIAAIVIATVALASICYLRKLAVAGSGDLQHI